jgi:hypothetical protein
MKLGRNATVVAAMVFASMTVLSTEAQATEDFCAVVLKTPDGFLALREGPGTQFGVKARLVQGDVLFADTRTCVIDHPEFATKRGSGRM